MSKRPKTRKPVRSTPSKPAPVLSTLSAHPRLVAALAAKMAERAARAGRDEANPDGDLLGQAAVVNRIFDKTQPLNTEEWQRALLRVSGLQPTTLPGLKAKIDIALMMAGLKPEPGDELDHLDRFVIWLALTDVQELLEDRPA